MDETLRINLIIIVSVSIFGLIVFVWVKNYINHRPYIDHINTTDEKMFFNKNFSPIPGDIFFSEKERG